MAGDGRLRLFCGLVLPPEAVSELCAWAAAHLHGGRLVPPGNVHVTLAFLGARPEDDVPAVAGALRAAVDDADGGLRLVPERYRETRSVGMIVLRDENGRATALAERLGALLEQAGLYRREARPWLPHATVLRFRERPRLRPPAPPTRTVVPSDAAVFMSVLRPGGARYDVIDTVPLDTAP